jgi:hypothetical protein
MIDNSNDNIELQRLLKENPLKRNDFRFQMITKKLFNINTLEEACEILQILLNGSTVIYDDMHKKYRGYRGLINFSSANGLSNKLLFNENVYKTFNSYP